MFMLCMYVDKLMRVFFQFSRKDQGVFKAVLSDDRGKDTSVFDISGQGTFSLFRKMLVTSFL